MTLRRPLQQLLFQAALLALATVACGANPSDEALLQANREMRDDLKRPREDRRQEVLWLNDGISVGLDQKTLDELRARAAASDRPEHRPDTASDDPADDALLATALAQDATLKLLAGDADAARTMLEASVEHHPTVDALEPLAAMLEAESDDEALVALCARTRKAVPENQVLAVLQTCHRRHSASDIESSLSWASEEDRTRLAVTLGQ